MGMTRVWYHNNCYDGFGSAWSAYKALGTENVVYVACSYGTKMPEYGPEDTIYIVDFSFSRQEMIDLKEKCKFLLVLDHHKTAEENLKGLDFCVFDMERSGAGMTWDHFHTTPRPRLINHIEDRDLWKFQIPGSKEVHAYLCSQPFDFKVWDGIADMLPAGDPDSNVYRLGEVLLKQKLNEVELTCKKAWLSEIDGHQVATVNTSAHWSEVGHQLLQQFPDAAFAASFTVFKGYTMWSLRGRGDFDVSEIARKFGGGGHKSAAGFSTVKV